MQAVFKSYLAMKYTYTRLPSKIWAWAAFWTRSKSPAGDSGEDGTQGGKIQIQQLRNADPLSGKKGQKVGGVATLEQACLSTVAVSKG